ncbi:MAG: hypothetical protein Q8O42_09355 [Acidobacteriota bacterium]|nr:hypothetical protein [Acidobacteriota bacterium]
MTNRSQRDTRLFVVLGCVLVALIVISTRLAPPERESMTPRHLENAVFQPPPASPAAGAMVSTLWTDFMHRPGTDFLDAMLPTQSGVLIISLIVALMVAFDYSRPRSRRNFELLALLVIGFLLFNVMRFFELLGDPTYFSVMDAVFIGIMTTSLLLIGLALWRVRDGQPAGWRPNLPAGALVTLTVLLFGLNVLIGVAKPPDDAGFYTNLGAQRLRERGYFPYGDPLLSNSAGAGYGPILYLAHLPFQLLLNPEPLNRTQPTRDDLGAGAGYLLPPALASQLTTVSFHFLGLVSLVVIGRRLAGPQVAWGIAALYCGSAYVMGVGGPREAIGGMTFISHIAPAAVSLLAFSALARPFAAGALLVASAATVFYPVLFFPAWLGHYWDRRASAWRFVAGCALAAVVIGVPVLALSQPIEGHGVLGTVVRESVGHHQGTDTYGQSTFGFWGQRAGIRAFFSEPLVAGEFTTTPMFLMTMGFAAGMFFLARKTTPQQLALITGALAIVAQLSKVHGTGVYVNWYYPFLLIGFLAYASQPRPQDDATLKSD